MLFVLVFVGAGLIAADQIIKVWAVTKLMPVREMDFIRLGGLDIIGFRYTENDGAAFSSFSGAGRWLLIANIALIAALIGYSVWFERKNKLAGIASGKGIRIPVMLTVSGGIGNIIDRVRLGYVIDYIEVRLFHFAIFNFADMCVVVGAFLLFIFVLRLEAKEKKAETGGD